MLFYLLAILCILLLWFLQSYIKWRHDVYQYIEKIKGPTKYPIVGTLYPFLTVKREDFFNAMMKELEEYKPFYRTWLGSTPVINIMTPEHIEAILGNSINLTKGPDYDPFKTWLGEGLLISTGSKWQSHRKQITPTFHFKILESYMEVFAEKSKLLVDILEEKCTGEIFDIYPIIKHCALDIICETAMGVQINAMTNDKSDYLTAIDNGGEMMLVRAFTPWYSSDLVYFLTSEGKKFQKVLDTLHGFTRQVIADRKELLLNKETTPTNDTESPVRKRLSFLDMLLSNSSLTNEEIQNEVDTFLFAGHDTTSTTISWVLYLLAHNPNIQEEVYQELTEVLGDKKSPDTLSELNELKYLERCIKEQLRLYPTVSFISRTLTEEITLDGYKVPKGSQCTIHIFAMHRNPDIYPDPLKYDPDRFLPENTARRHPYAFVPFSAGPRNCIGQKFAMYQTKTILAAILKSYRVKPVDDEKSLKLLSEIVLRSQNGIRVILEKREK